MTPAPLAPCPAAAGLCLMSGITDNQRKTITPLWWVTLLSLRTDHVGAPQGLNLLDLIQHKNVQLSQY
jgi:hypothetical protein